MASITNGSLRRSRNLAEQLVAILSERIHDGSLRPGDKLPTEFEMAVNEGVSRTVVREAISRLQAAGLVETRHGIGTFVLAPAPLLKLEVDPASIMTIRDVLFVLELRISLEVEAAGLAAARRSEQQLREMDEALACFEASITDSGDTVKPDFDFHLKIAEATENPYFIDVMRRLGTTTIPRQRIINQAMGDPNYLRGIHSEHENIYRAILDRDPERARMMMRIHLSASHARIRRAHDEAEAKKSQVLEGEST
jgi:GntR family transcriptional regulator, transcriptional repressor for pyruvate dehydrogenase complex